METFQKPKFFNNMVGGVDQLDGEQTKNQLKILQLQGRHNKYANSDQKNKLRLFNDLQKSHVGKELDDTMIKQDEKISNKPSTQYNPLTDWKEKHGLVGETNSRYDVHYLHIDSSDRQIIPTMEISDYYTLSENPILTTELSNKIFISHPNNTFQVEDKITIDGLAPAKYKLRFEPTATTRPIEFEIGKTYMTINFNHGIPESHASDSEVGRLFIMIENFTNEQPTSSTGNGMYYGNITLTFINSVHNFFLVDPDLGITYNPTKLYVTLPYAYDTYPGTPTTIPSYFDITLYYVNGLPMNEINAQYPTDIYHNNYYQIIREVTSDGYYVDLNSSYYALSSGNVGGKTIRIGRISNFIGGYLEPNNYVIPLERIYKNVVSVRLISSEFPNSEYVIKDYPESSRNNKIYWQNYEDGSYVYSIEIPPGKYNPTTLTNIIESKFYDTKRFYYPSVTQNYTDHNYMQVTIDTDTDTTTIKSYKQAIMTRAFENMYYIITNSSTGQDHAFTPVAATPTLDPNAHPEQLYPIFIVIKYIKHGLKMNTSYVSHVAGQDYVPNDTKGDTIIISGVTAFKGVSAEKIDGTYEVYAPNAALGLSAIDYFMIKLQPFDIGQYTTRGDGQFGGIFNMYIPNIFRLLFNYSDTIGKLLGFPNTGETYAVTKYAESITNKDAYQPDISPEMTIDATTPGNAIILSGHNYILMVCNEFPVIETIGKIKDAFAKILLVGIPGKTCFNTFVSTPKIFYEPIQELSQLTLSFYSPVGELYDFNGLEHSFTIEITTLDELPFDTHINTHTGKIL